MDSGDAVKVIKILCDADGGCMFCAQDLITRFIRDFPEHAILARELFKHEFDYDYTGEVN